MKKVYVSYVCGYAAIREMGTDKVLHTFKGKRSYEQFLVEANKIANEYHWEIV